ncbi:MAG: hypothetical protein B6D44_15255 [Ignavibacteriales bacterium UTCHB2]|jgi:hypothetical protein|nr:MAG: hypothetical protein B6D44_15255 [Ignavibacteriales bacterium UTCHB2]
MVYQVKIEFKDYPSGSWQDWSEYLSEPPFISKKVESENEGEAGLIVFDDAEVSFRYESGSPVYDAFSIDLSAKQRYLFRISAPKTDKTFVQLFEGIADFSTLKWNEFENIISFSIVDKLSALNLLQGELTRILDTLNARVLAQYPNANGLEFRVDNNFPNEIWIKPAFGDSSSYYLNGFSSPILFPGEIIRDPYSMGGSAPSPVTYALVTESWIDAGLWNRIKYIKVDGFDYTNWLNETTYYRYPVWFIGSTVEYGQKEIYGIDILNYNAGIPQSINGFSLIDVLIKKAWSDVTIVYRGISSYNIPLSYYILFLDENPLGKTPLDALKMIADSMKVYVFTDKTGNIIVQSKSPLDTGGTTRSIGSTKIVSGPEKKYFWDKLVDGVTVNVKSWAVDDLTGENLVGVAELTKQPTGFSALQKIKPKNSIKRDLLVGDPTVNTQAELDTYAANIALSILDFYGKRHSSFDLTLNLDDNTIDWELIDNLSINSLTTFFTKLDIDLVSRTISLEAVEIRGHDYDFRQLVFGAAESSGSSIISSSSSGGGSYYSGITPIFNLPLQMSGGIVSLLTTDNLKLTSNQLDTIQPIKITDTPTFNQMLLGAAASLSNHAVRADRTLQIITTAPLTGGGSAVDLTADRTWTLGINSASLLGTTNQVNVTNGTGVILGSTNVTLSLPQNIHSGATPTFNQIILSSAGASNQAVRGDRAVNTSYPLTGGGNLTADRTLGLGYNTTNLKLTSNQLNTIQDIAKSSSPTFNNLTVDNNLLVKKNILGANSATNFDPNSRITSINFLPNGFIEYYLNFRFEQDVLRFANKRPDKFTITYSNDFNSAEINILFSYYANSVNLQGKSENCWIQVDCNDNSLGDIPTMAYVLFHSNNNPVSVKIEMQGTANPGTWYTVFDGNGYTALGNFTPNGIPGGFIKKIKWTFYNISTSGPTYIRWIGHLVQRGEAYRHTVTRYGDTMFGDLLYYGGAYKIGSGDNNDFSIITNNTNRITVKSNGDVGIGTSSPSYKLDISGTGRFTGNLTLSAILDQQGTSGTNIFKADINQQGNKSIYNNFTSGWTGSGWRIDYGLTATNRSHLELDDLTVRGTMRVYELLINQIRATNGSLFVSSTAKVSSVGAGTTGDYSITFEDPEGNGYLPFADNDIIKMQRVDLDGTSIIRYLIGKVWSHTGNTIEFLILDGTDTPQKGDVFVRIGNTSNTSRQGTVYLTSDDTASPYIDIYDGVTGYANWATAAVRKVRLGKLSGLTDSNFGALSGYGLYATNAYLKGGIWASFGNIAGWTIESQKISKIYSHPVTGEANEVALNASSNDIGLHVWMDKDAINVPSMLSIGAIKDYTNTLSANEYGIQYRRGSDTYFRLTNSVQQIAGWNFNNLYLWKLTSGTPTSSPAGGIVMNSNGAITVYGNYWQKRVALYYSAANNWGLIGTNESYQTVFQLGYTNQIAGWTFDTVKLTKGAATLGISLNTGSTPFITGTSAKGFEVYDYTNPKLFLGQKDGNSLDWNITKANTLTIKGEITTSRFSTNSDFAGSYDYVVIDKDVNGHFLTVQKYIDASNTSRVRIQPNGTTDLISIYHQVSGVAQTINFQYYNTKLDIFINGSPATRYRGNGTTLPTTDLRDGDMYYFTSTGKVYVYAYGGWRVLN